MRYRKPNITVTKLIDDVLEELNGDFDSDIFLYPEEKAELSSNFQQVLLSGAYPDLRIWLKCRIFEYILRGD